VPIEGAPPVTAAGDSAKDEIFAEPGVAGVIDNDADAELADVAVIIAVAAASTGDVLTGNVPDDAPCGIVIDPGTVAEPLFEPRLTSTPPVPAGAESCTVAVDAEPPLTDDGESVSEVIVPVPDPAIFTFT
jgi:hypothetical protein